MAALLALVLVLAVRALFAALPAPQVEPVRLRRQPGRRDRHRQ